MCWHLELGSEFSCKSVGNEDKVNLLWIKLLFPECPCWLPYRYIQPSEPPCRRACLYSPSVRDYSCTDVIKQDLMMRKPLDFCNTANQGHLSMDTGTFGATMANITQRLARGRHSFPWRAWASANSSQKATCLLTFELDFSACCPKSQQPSQVAAFPAQVRSQGGTANFALVIC